jgi:hypothetical protein
VDDAWDRAVAAEATRIEWTRERRLRRRARRLGYRLVKRRGVAANWCGPNYMLVDAHYGTVVLHDGGCYWNRATLDDVEAYVEKLGEREKNFDCEKAVLGR